MTSESPHGDENIVVPPRAAAELLDINQVSTITGISTRTLYRLADAGKMPRPLKIGTLNRWRAEDLRDWIDAGCPPMKHMRKRGAK